MLLLPGQALPFVGGNGKPVGPTGKLLLAEFEGKPDVPEGGTVVEEELDSEDDVMLELELEDVVRTEVVEIEVELATVVAFALLLGTPELGIEGAPPAQ